MRKLVMFNRVSADGYFADASGGLDWSVPEPAIDKEAVKNLGGSDTVLFGRKTYENFESFWPHVLDQSPTAPDPHGAGRRTPEMRAIAVWLNDATKLVYSSQRKDVSWKNSRLLARFDPDQLRELKQQPGKDLIIFGSGSIVSLLAQHRLIDEYRFVVNPVLLGSGQSMLRGLPKCLKLQLQESKAYPAGNVLLAYRPAD